ncbi:hypothetical protein cyc_05782 [Cyclospora cayetanensis]|uniref:Uncharacterized protein n=1 Tax=Cyclospora cayetanensis TaxID=88456 RepID=A0A1D3D935_9EIME|nr:hypothetical protein cyc_05782 [Cyclospora cayetanensis]
MLKKEDVETPVTMLPPSPGVCLLYIDPLSPEDYLENFAEGDLAESYRSICCTTPSAFRGSWQLLLGGRSDSVEELLAALGIGVLKRKVMASYASVTDVQPIEGSKTSSGDASSSYPTFQLTTHLPLKNTKQGIFCFDGSCSELQDADTGAWETRCVWLNGRAIQKRWGPKGVMWDTRCVFSTDPFEANPLEGLIMLFQKVSESPPEKAEQQSTERVG